MTNGSNWNKSGNNERSAIAIDAILVFAILAGLVTGAAWASEDGLTSWDVAKMRSVREVALSPDGQTVAYVLEVPRRPLEDEDGSACRELHVVDPQGHETGTSRPFVTGDVRVEEIGWTPDGTKISFIAERDGDEEPALYTIALAGGEARRVVALASAVTDYSFSPDGKRVAVLGREPESEKSRELEEKGFTQEIFEEDWRPIRVWVAALDDDGRAGEPQALALEGSARGVYWSPTGDRLALKVAPTPLVDDRYMFTRVRVVDSGSGEVLARIDNPGKLGDLAWSPDGRHLAMIAGADAHDPSEGRLMVAPAEGGALVDLLPGLLGHIRAVAWRDARRLVYLSHEGTGTRIGEIGVDGGSDKTLVPAATASGPGPIVEDLSLAPGGELALRASTPTHPNEVFFLAAGATAPRRLTDCNPWLAEVRLAPQEVVRYSARDGLELEGLLIRPLDEKRGERYPLLLIIHGGPEAHYKFGWLTSYSRPGQVAAARGFMVFYPNYRASTGRGVEFSMLDHGDPAGKEFDDFVDGVDHLVAAGLVDTRRVGITGGSYGGYATAWAATYYSDRFAAAVMSAGISNLIAKFGTSDIPQEMYLVHERQWPWEDFQHFLDRSPIHHVEQARTPILIAHGQKDARVYPGQGMQLYRYLKVLGKAPVRLVLYPDEEHGNRRAASRLDYSLRQMRWIEHYLKGPGGEPPPWEIDYGEPAPAAETETETEQ
ncbi:MAG: S9 family peptidase [bacterium]|nr:S9 family peptidase [bacterium]